MGHPCQRPLTLCSAQPPSHKPSEPLSFLDLSEHRLHQYTPLQLHLAGQTTALQSNRNARPERRQAFDDHRLTRWPEGHHGGTPSGAQRSGLWQEPSGWHSCPSNPQRVEEIQADSRILATVLNELEAMGHPVQSFSESYIFANFARPVGIMVDPDTDRLRSGVDVFRPATAVGF